MTVQDEFLPYILPSKDMQACCLKEERIFQPWEIASLIYMNSHLTFAKRTELFKRLAETIESTAPSPLEKPDFPGISDFDLLSQLKTHLEYEKFLLNSFYDNHGATYSYLIHNENDDYRAARYEYFYSTADKAKADALEELEKFHRKENGEYETSEIRITRFYMDERTLLEGIFTLQGELQSLDFLGENLTAIIPEKFHHCYDLPDPKYFEQKYVHLPHPFRAGDFIKTIGDKEIGIYTGDETEEAYRKNQLHLKKLTLNKDLVFPIDYSDISCRAEYYDPGSKHFSHSHPNLTDLEKTELPENFKQKDLYLVASDLLRSGGSIEALQQYLDT